MPNLKKFVALTGVALALTGASVTLPTAANAAAPTSSSVLVSSVRTGGGVTTQRALVCHNVLVEKKRQWWQGCLNMTPGLPNALPAACYGDVYKRVCD